MCKGSGLCCVQCQEARSCVVDCMGGKSCAIFEGTLENVHCPGGKSATKCISGSIVCDESVCNLLTN
jgi:hypothetical protein